MPLATGGATKLNRVALGFRKTSTVVLVINVWLNIDTIDYVTRIGNPKIFVANFCFDVRAKVSSSTVLCAQLQGGLASQEDLFL